MAEPEVGTALVPAPHPFTITVRDLDSSGKVETYSLVVPDADPVWRAVLLKAGFLKKGVMRDYDFGSIVCLILYADSMGLNALAGDVYLVSGRLATTADAKIRHALGSGLIEGYKVEITDGPEVEIPWQTARERGTWKGINYHATVTVNVKGWAVPVVYEADLAEWFTGANPNWRTRPKFMFRKNALSKALAEVAPMGVEADEAPPVESALPQVGRAAQLRGQPELQTVLEKSIEVVAK